MTTSCKVIDLLTPGVLESCQYLLECVENERRQEGPVGVSKVDVRGEFLTVSSLAKLGATTDILQKDDEEYETQVGIRVNHLALLECAIEGPLGYTYFNAEAIFDHTRKASRYSLRIDEAWITSSRRGMGHGIAMASAVGSYFGGFIYLLQTKMSEEERLYLKAHVQIKPRQPHPEMQAFITNVKNAALSQHKAATKGEGSWAVQM